MQPSQITRAMLCLLVLICSAAGAPSSSPSQGEIGVQQTDCGPCGWIHYRNGNRNLFTRLDVTENIFCQCPSTQRCRLWATKPAYSVHIFKCQAEDSTNIAFPSLTSRRKRGAHDLHLNGILELLENSWNIDS